MWAAIWRRINYAFDDLRNPLEGSNWIWAMQSETCTSRWYIVYPSGWWTPGQDAMDVRAVNLNLRWRILCSIYSSRDLEERSGINPPDYWMAGRWQTIETGSKWFAARDISDELSVYELNRTTNAPGTCSGTVGEVEKTRSTLPYRVKWNEKNSFFGETRCIPRATPQSLRKFLVNYRTCPRKVVNWHHRSKWFPL